VKKNIETILIGGGARSGKSRFSLDLAVKRGEKLVFIATGSAQDEEMRKRIENHRAERRDLFRTIEEPLEIIRAMREEKKADVVLVDCLTFWVSTLCMTNVSEEKIQGYYAELYEFIQNPPFDIIFVTNEVGQGLVPENPLGRKFRDFLGTLNQELGSRVDRIYWSIMGVRLCIKPELKIVQD